MSKLSPSLTAAVLIIGDEILSGRTRDSNLNTLARFLAPLGVDPTGPFEQLAALHERLLLEHPAATMRSAGMSADLEAAVAAGATHVRLGSALLGHRPA